MQNVSANRSSIAIASPFFKLGLRQKIGITLPSVRSQPVNHGPRTADSRNEVPPSHAYLAIW
jgi:hypothetical protein